jgi:hypothetical protein
MFVRAVIMLIALTIAAFGIPLQRKKSLARGCGKARRWPHW